MKIWSLSVNGVWCKSCFGVNGVWFERFQRFFESIFGKKKHKIFEANGIISPIGPIVTPTYHLKSNERLANTGNVRFPGKLLQNIL